MSPGTTLAGALLVLVASLLPGACAAEPAKPPAASPSPSPVSSTGSARTYGMGFFETPSIPTNEATLALVPRMAKVADFILLQREVPWSRIAAGDSFERIFNEDYAYFAKYLRENRLELVLMVDPLDGLNRTAEAQEAVKNRKSLLDPASMATHEAWVLAVVSRLKPRYVGLASEINTLAAHGNHELYERIRGMSNELAPRIRSISPGTRVFVSFQVEDAWGKAPFGRSKLDQFGLTRDFDVDAIGLSSYPALAFKSPAEIPADYFQRFAQASGKPILLAEGGWSADSSPVDRARQAEYYERLFALLDSARAELAISLLYNDLDLSDPRWGLTADRRRTLERFGNDGIVDSQGRPKAAYDVWKAHFQRRRE